jgi:hypothetical protein
MWLGLVDGVVVGWGKVAVGGWVQGVVRCVWVLGAGVCPPCHYRMRNVVMFGGAIGSRLGPAGGVWEGGGEGQRYVYTSYN